MTTTICIVSFLSTLSLRRATTSHRVPWKGTSISIHALLAESDNPLKLAQTSLIISIHALLAESDFELFPKRFSNSLFLSTLSLRRATHDGRVNLFGFQHFYPRSPCGERPLGGRAPQPPQGISIHALLAESDPGKIWSTAFAE